MSEESYRYGRKRMGWPLLALATLVIAGGLGLYWLNSSRVSSGPRAESLTVYCAAGIRKPVEETAKRYEEEFGTRIRLDYGSSGELESKLILDRTNRVHRGDLYIPADEFFSDRTRARGLTAESIGLAQFRIVFAVKPDSSRSIGSVRDILDQQIPFAICDELAGAGKKTKEALARHGLWDPVNAAKKTSFPRVPEAANAVKTSESIEGAFVWDSTAKQFGLKPIVLPELDGAVGSITINLVTTTPQPSRALHFARYLSSPEKGHQAFQQHFFEPVAGDPWADVPQITVYCGGVNRHAVKDTIAAFEEREGCRIRTQYAGCGTLVGSMKTGQAGLPDVFMTCDVSYMTKVEDQFDEARDVSSTDIVFLVRKGNPKGIHSLKDLARADLEIGTTDPAMSTLGDLSWQMFRDTGVVAAIETNKSVVVTTPTAHELIAQMQGHQKLDVTLVYRANCQNLDDRFELVAIDHPKARAVQNVAVARATPFPLLAQRLMEMMTSAESRRRFVENGFHWEAAERAEQR